MKATADSSRTDEFVSLVTHELKNALTLLNGHSFLAREAIMEHDDAMALESIDTVCHETERVLRLVEDLLDLAQVSAGKFSVQMEQVDLEKLVWEVASRYSKPSRRRIDIHVTEKSPCILGDAQRLAQVVENLLSNATKYSPVETAIRVGLTGSDSRVTLSVWNGGSTIHSDEMPQMVQSFSRGAGVRAAEEVGKAVLGHGLGLFISRQITEMHGGRMSVLSEAGGGTTFTVELPRLAAVTASEHS